MRVVAVNIAAAIKRSGSNPAEVARRAGINPTGVYDILSGKSKHPRLDTLQKIASHGLQIPFFSLFTETSEIELDAELVTVLSQLPLEERRRFLVMAKAILAANEVKRSPER